jgi:ABC-type polar amino acid transport system ATPase subunit
VPRGVLLGVCRVSRHSVYRARLVIDRKTLAAQPRVLLLDEPSLGLSGVTLHSMLLTLQKRATMNGTAVVVAEQRLGSTIADPPSPMELCFKVQGPKCRGARSLPRLAT